MNTIKVLTEGYAKILPNGGWIANPAIVFIQTENNLKVIVDPGCNRPLLLQKLAENNLSVDEINYVFLTHHHTDHSLNMALFPKAKVIDYEAIFEGDQATPIGKTIPETDLKILQTPGHQPYHVSLMIPTVEGNVVVAGDVFWFTEGEKEILDIDKKDLYATDFETLKQSRQKILEIADIIIPGHGKTIKNEKH